MRFFSFGLICPRFCGCVCVCVCVRVCLCFVCDGEKESRLCVCVCARSRGAARPRGRSVLVLEKNDEVFDFCFSDWLGIGSVFSLPRAFHTHQTFPHTPHPMPLIFCASLGAATRITAGAVALPGAPFPHRRRSPAGTAGATARPSRPSRARAVAPASATPTLAESTPARTGSPTKPLPSPPTLDALPSSVRRVVVRLPDVPNPAAPGGSVAAYVVGMSHVSAVSVDQVREWRDGRERG